MDTTPQQAADGLAIVKILADVLDRIVQANMNHAQTDPGQITKFHALKAPGIGILQYLERIHRYASCSNECFILALIYIDRLIQRNNFLLTELNVHRVVITAMLLAAKFFDDAYYNNAYYSKVGGVLVSELNGLEVDFLFRINFSLHVTPEEFQQYKDRLQFHCAAAGVQPYQLAGLPDEIVPSNDQQVIHPSHQVPSQMQPISCAPAMPMQPPAGAPQLVTPSSSHSASHLQAPNQAAAYPSNEDIVNHQSTVAAAAVAAAAAAAELCFPNELRHQLLQRANSMPAQSVAPRCALNPPFSAPMVSMVTNSNENDPYVVIDNQIFPIQNVLNHYHYGLQQYHAEASTFQVQSDGAYQINRDSLVSGHY